MNDDPMTAPSAQAVLAARAGLADLSFDLANDLFGATWLASHVRLVELLPDAATSRALLLAHVLAGNPVEELAPEEWLPDARFRAAARDELAQLIELAAADVEEAEERLNRVLADALARLAADAAQAIFAIEADPEKQRPARPYSYGPTYQTFWISAGRFYFLEVHLES